LLPWTQDRFQMAPSSHVVSFPPHVLPYLPPAVTHTLVGFGLGFRMHRGEVPAELWERIYHHRGIAIRSLAEGVNSCEMLKRDAVIDENNTLKERVMIDYTIMSLITFLSVEVCLLPIDIYSIVVLTCWHNRSNKFRPQIGNIILMPRHGSFSFAVVYRSPGKTVSISAHP